MNGKQIEENFLRHGLRLEDLRQDLIQFFDERGVTPSSERIRMDFSQMILDINYGISAGRDPLDARSDWFIGLLDRINEN